MIERKAIVYFLDSPNVGHFDDGRFVEGAWVIVRYRYGGFLHWETFNTEDEALAAQYRWEEEGRI